jgi:hypothetical protein
LIDLPNSSIGQKRCLCSTILLSHISIDKKAAVAIDEYIREQAQIDTYLDIYDEELQIAVREGDSAKITEFIEKGINKSSHLMCLVSERTVNSWWVPYEIGFAKKSSTEIATLALKDAVTLPEFLEICIILEGTKSLNDYLQTIDRDHLLFESVSKQLIRHTHPNHPLDAYLRWDE